MSTAARPATAGALRALAGAALAVAALVPLVAPRARAEESAAGSEQGHAVFAKWCAPCHGPGTDKPGTVALGALYKGEKPALLEQRTDLSCDMVRRFVRTGVSVMPFFRKTEITDAELTALAGYLSHGPCR